jgi:hypothetical protein
MNSAGNSNRDLDEPISVGQKCVIALLRLLLPPHRDNENAADYLRTQIGQNDNVIEWAAVRPDNLIDETAVTAFTAHPSPIKSAIFDAGRTSRINVGSFMADLITDDDTWSKWKGQMPVIYNEDPPQARPLDHDRRCGKTAGIREAHHSARHDHFPSRVDHITS